MSTIPIYGRNGNSPVRIGGVSSFPRSPSIGRDTDIPTGNISPWALEITCTSPRKERCNRASNGWKPTAQMERANASLWREQVLLYYHMQTFKWPSTNGTFHCLTFFLPRENTLGSRFADFESNMNGSETMRFGLATFLIGWGELQSYLWCWFRNRCGYIHDWRSETWKPPTTVYYSWIRCEHS